MIRCHKCSAVLNTCNCDFPESEDTIPTEDQMKSLIREVIAEGRKRKEVKKSVKKHLIKSGTGTRETIAMRIKESHKRIDKYWKEILAEKQEKNDEDLGNNSL